MSTPRYTLYGWQLSYYSAKVRCYLAHKQAVLHVSAAKGPPLRFDDVPVNLPTLLWRIKRKTGAVVMPVLVTPQGEWLQDSSEILDTLEARHPDHPLLPATPLRRFAAYLLEAWADEWWVPPAMHSRWSYPENYPLFEREAGAALLPGFPAFVQRRAVAHIANTLRGMLDGVGVRAEQTATLERWTVATLDQLDAHFRHHPYLLGQTPTLADFALAGPMVAHLGRDPWPARTWVNPRCHLRAWADRMADPSLTAMPEGACWPGPALPLGELGSGASACALAATDTLPATLEPLWRNVFGHFVPLLEGIRAELERVAPSRPAGHPLPRGLGDVTVPLAQGNPVGATFSRAALPYTLWMAQRVRDVFGTMPAQEQARLQAWLDERAGGAWLTMNLPRLQRRALRVAVASGTA